MGPPEYTIPFPLPLTGVFLSAPGRPLLSPCPCSRLWEKGRMVSTGVQALRARSPALRLLPLPHMFEGQTARMDAAPQRYHYHGKGRAGVEAM